MGAELSRKRRGKKTRTGMSESKLEDFVSKSVGDAMKNNAVKAISKYLRKQQRHPDPHGPDAGKRPSGQGATGPTGKPSMRNPYPATQEESTAAKKRLGPPMDPAGYSVDKQESDKDFKTALDAFSTKPKTPKEAAAAVEDRRKYDEAAARIKPPKRVVSSVDKGLGDAARTVGSAVKTGAEAVDTAARGTKTGRAVGRFKGGVRAATKKAASTVASPPLMMQETGAKQPKGLIKTISAYTKENGYPPTKGERRDAKRTKAKKMRVVGAGAKNLQRIIGRKAEAAGGMDKAKPSPKRDALRDMGLTQRTNIPKPREMDLPSDPKPTQVSIGGRRLQVKSMEKNIIKAINKFWGKQSSEATAADPESAKRAASRARQEASVGEEYPAPYGKDPKPSFAAIERPEGTRRSSAGQGGAMVAFGKKSEKRLVKAISTYLKDEEYPKSKAIDLTNGVKPPKEMADRARKALAAARTARRAAKNGKPASYDVEKIVDEATA